MKTLLRLALRNLARNRRRSLITLAALGFGVVAVLLVTGVARGFVTFLAEATIDTKVGAVQIHRKGYLKSLEALPLDLNIVWDDALRTRVRAVPGVLAASGRITFAGMASNGATQTMVVARAIDPAEEKETCPRMGLDVPAANGRPLAPGDDAIAVAGDELAKSLSVGPTGIAPPGRDFLTVSTTMLSGQQNVETAKLAGLAVSGFQLESKRTLVVPLTFAQRLLGMPGKVTEVAVRVGDYTQADVVAERLRAELGGEYEVSTWKDLQPFFRDAIAYQSVIAGIVSAIVFAVVIAGVVNTMLMSVFERVREIGTLLALGMRRRQVLGLILLEAAALGLFGALVGAVLGNLALLAIAARGVNLKVFGGASLLRPVLTVEATLMAIATAVVAAVAAGLYPAWRASRESPIEAINSAKAG